MTESNLTQYMVDLIKETNSSALIKQFVKSSNKPDLHFENDYLDEDAYMPVRNLIHRYNNKVIIIVTNQCACYCQFCTRQRYTRKEKMKLDNLMEIKQYLKMHPEVDDVLITGGDPLVLSTNELISILDEISKLQTIKILRIGTRIPITLPKRIDKELISALKRFSNLYINIHINHPDELTTQSEKAILSLANAGIPLGSQTVLLKGVNDNYDVLKKLFQQLVYIKVKPYYLYQCDRVTGCENFVVDIKVGINIINKMCNQVSGFAIPKFVVDTPKQGKKVLAPYSKKLEY